MESSFSQAVLILKSMITLWWVSSLSHYASKIESEFRTCFNSSKSENRTAELPLNPLKYSSFMQLLLFDNFLSQDMSIPGSVSHGLYLASASVGPAMTFDFGATCVSARTLGDTCGDGAKLNLV